MAAAAVFFNSKICSAIFFLLLITCRLVYGEEVISEADSASMALLVSTGTDIIKSTYELAESVEYIRQNHLNTPAFEVGYLMFSLFEKYRKMIDKYNTTHTMGYKLWVAELVLYLEDVEHHYWEVDHLSNMLHEIERKYGIESKLGTKYRELTSDELFAAKQVEKAIAATRPSTTKKWKIKQEVIDRLKPTTVTKKKGPFPIDYGWEINYLW